MSRDDARDRVVEIMAALGKAREFVGSMSLADFTGDDKTMYAVIRALEIAGEAAKRVPEAIRVAHPTVPWRFLAGMRDKLCGKRGRSSFLRAGPARRFSLPDWRGALRAGGGARRGHAPAWRLRSGGAAVPELAYFVYGGCFYGIMNTFLHTRNFYQGRIRPWVGKPVIKVLTGMRRVGKSCVLRQTASLLPPAAAFFEAGSQVAAGA
jgi:uncharacterized protein with HEPN domain